MNKVFIVGLLVILPMVVFAYPDEVFHWKTIEYNKPPLNLTDKIGNDPYYIARNNRPTGFTVWKNKFIVAIPRRAPGIISTLNIIEERDSNHKSRSPKLVGYPDYKTNQLTARNKYDLKRIVSVYETQIDKCDRLWFIDVGTLEYGGRAPIFIQNPSIWIIDLQSRETIRRIDLTKKQVTGFSSITVDISDKDCCENAYAYIPAGNKIITYSFGKNKFWVTQAPFSAKPNIISIALSKPSRSGLRTAYFHLEPTYDTNSRIEFSVSTTVLKSGDSKFFPVNNLGIRDGNSYMHDIDQKSGVMFLTSYTRNAITCWNPSKTLKPSNMATLHQDDNTLNSPTSLQVDGEGFVWYLATRFDKWTATDYNFRVFRFNAKNEIRNNVCNPRKHHKHQHYHDY